MHAARHAHPDCYRVATLNSRSLPMPAAPRSRLVDLLAVVLALTVGLRAQTTVVVPCAADNTLYYHAQGELSNGVGQGLFVGTNGLGLTLRTVLRFDVAAAVPAGASIVAAQLTVRSQKSMYVPLLDVTAHRVLQAWGEGSSVAPSGGGYGGQAQTNDATWLHALYPNTFWTTPGGDFVAQPSTTLQLPAVGTVSSAAGPGTVADVQSWLDQPGQNFGWLLKADETVFSINAHRLASRTAAGGRPTLTVTYLQAGQTGTWGTGCPTTNGTFTFAYVGAMTGGGTIQLVHSNGPPSTIGVNYFALDLHQPGNLLQPDCSLYLPPFPQTWILGEVFVLDAAGAATLPWLVPAIYPGLYFVTQSAALDSSPFGLALTNAGVGKIL